MFMLIDVLWLSSLHLPDISVISYHINASEMSWAGVVYYYLLLIWITFCRDQKDIYSATNGGNGTVNEQSVILSSQRAKPLPSTKFSDSVKKQCLRSRTRSLEHMTTSDVKHESAKRLRSDIKDSGAKASGRLRSQSVEREDTRELSSSSKCQTQMKLTIPHTPQLLK